MLKLPSGFSNQPSNDGLTLWPLACGRGASSLSSWAGARTPAASASTPPTAAASSIRGMLTRSLLVLIAFRSVAVERL